MEKYIKQWRRVILEHEDDINAGAGILLFSKDGKVLLSKRSKNVPKPLTIVTIGGHITKGEDPVDGAKRAFAEEAGFTGPFDGLTRLSAQKNGDFVYYSYIASTSNPDQSFDPDPEFADEILWNRWLDFEEIRTSDELHPGLKELFADETAMKQIRTFIQEIE